MDMTEFQREIRAFLLQTGMRPSTFGHRAVNDGKFVARLERGGQVTVRTVGRVRSFMARHLLGSAERDLNDENVNTPKAA